MDTLTEAQRIKNIQQAIRTADADLKQRYPILNHQDAIGLIICLSVFAGMIATGLAYIYDLIPAWLCIVIATIFASISHELEHDLIHHMYFRKNRFVQNIMMAIVWIMRPNTVHPWYRRGMHFNHHKVSGTKDDIEERVLGNGMKLGLKRVLISLDGFLSISLRYNELKSMKNYNFFKFAMKGMPLGHVYVISLYAFVAFHSYDFLAPIAGLSTAYDPLILEAVNILNIMAVVWILPNFLRALCLHNVTAMMHYYGDVDSLLKQCQVMNHWVLAPLHIFCFNFASTHAMHHFVVSQPFYLRQMCAKYAHPVMKENGVRFNDFGTMLRSNRFSKTEQVDSSLKTA